MLDVVIIGTGFGGISAAINLNKAHITNYVMLERRSFAGGTWKQNRYPGAAVDVYSILYSLENETYDWSRMFATQSELAEYTNHLIQKHRLNDKIQLNVNVTSTKWQNDHWLISTEDGAYFCAKTVINATGPLSTPVTPKIKGLEFFKGESFHANDWPDNVDFKNKKIAVIGSGASAVQIIPELAKCAETLHVFQRTPHWILYRPDFTFPAWLRKLLKINSINKLFRMLIYWQLELRVIAFKYSKLLLKLVGEYPARLQLKMQVPDFNLRKKLVPDFIIGCKRILITNSYLPALQKKNVVLHDKTEAINAFTENGIETSTSTIDVDIVVFATGYDPQASIVSHHIVGRHGVSLDTQWQAFPRAYLGTSMPSFPNFFVVTGPNTGIGHTSAIHIIESQMRYIMSCITLLRDDVSTIEPTEHAEDTYTKMIHREMQKTVWHYGGCTSWYQNASGKVIAMFPGFSFSFRRLCEKFKRDDHHIT